MSKSSGIVIPVLLCLVGASAWAQPTPVIRTETRVVLVDAIVTDKQGQYVPGLTAKDFRLWEDNKEQAIQSVSLEQGAANSRPRYLVLFFAGMSATDQLQSRQTISNFIDADVAENRKMAVVSYSGDLRIDQNFTDDPGRLKDGVNRAISSGLTTGTADSAALNTLRALETLATNLRVLPGRKIIVLLSGGLQQSSFQKSELLAAMEACNKSDVAVYPVDVRPLSSQMGNKNDVRSASEGATSVPGIRPRGVDKLQGDAHEEEVNAPEPATGGQQILFAMANGTGGLVIPDFAELQRGLQRIGEEQAEYYTISYAPPDSSGSKADNCHRLRVKVDRSGTTIRARTNYCSTKPQDLLAGTSTGQDLERRAVGAQAGGLAASVQLSYFYISPNVARAYLAMDIPPEALKFEKRKGKLHAELNFLGIATAPDGNVGARFSDALKFDFDSEAQVAGLRGKPLHYQKQFKIAPGRYTFAIAFGSGSESFGKLELPLAVEARTPGELAVSSLALSRETHAAADLGLGGSLIEDSTPLIADNVEVVPSGSNQFTKSEAGFFYCEVYAADPASVRARVRVLDRNTGEPKSDSGFLKLDPPKSSPVNGADNAIPAASRLPIDGLAAGNYQLEVTAQDSAGKQVKRTADFEIR